MIKILKFTVFPIFFLLLFVVVAIAGVLLWVDPNDYNVQLTQLVETHTGRRLTIKERFSLSFFPRFGVRLGALTLGNREGFGAESFASISSAHVQVKLLPLLHGRLEVGKLTVQGLSLNLEKNSSGAVNWADLTKQPEKSVKVATETTEESAETRKGKQEKPAAADGTYFPASPVFGTVIFEGIELTDARISWRDAATNRSKQLKNLTMTTGRLQEDAPIPLVLQFRVVMQEGGQEEGEEEGEGPPFDLDLSFDGELVASLARQNFHLKSDHTTLVGTGKAIPAGKMVWDMVFDLEADLKEARVRISTWQLSGLGLQVKGHLEGQDILSSPRILGNLAVQNFSLREALPQWGMAVPSTRDPHVLDVVGVTLAFQADKSSLTLQDLSAQLDESRLKGTVAIHDFEKKEIRWNLSLDTLDLNRYLSPSTHGQQLPTSTASKVAAASVDVVAEGSPPASHGTQGSVSAPNERALEVLNGLVLDGRLHIGQLKVDDLTLREMETLVRGKKGTLSFSAMKTKFRRGKMSADVVLAATGLETDLRQETMHLEGFTWSGLGLKFEAQARGGNIFSSPQFVGSLATQTFSPREVLKAWGEPPPATQDPKVLNLAKVALKFNVDQDRLSLQDLQGQLDESRLSGTLAIHDFETMRVRWDLSADTLDIARYLAPPARAEVPRELARNVAKGQQTGLSTISTGGRAKVSEGGTLPLKYLRSLDLEGRLRVEKLKVDRLAMQTVDARIQGKKGVLRLSSLSARLYQGRLSADATLDVSRSSLPRITLNNRLDGVQSGPLLLALDGRDLLAGVADYTSHLTSTGDTLAGIKKNLGGKALFSFKNGKIKGVDIPKMLRDAYDLIRGRKPEAKDREQVTDFTRFSGSITIDNGVLKNQDLSLVSPLLRIHGEGFANLPEDRVDYRVDTSVEKALRGKGGRTIEALTGLTIPIRVTGSIGKPSWKLDMENLLEQEVAKKTREKIENKVQEKIVEQMKKRGLDKILPPDVGKRLLEAFPFR